MTPMDASTFLLDGKPVPYRVRVSERSRRISLRFTETGLEVVAPARARSFSPEPILSRFSGWIRRQIIRHEALAESRRRFEGTLLLRGQEVAVETLAAGGDLRGWIFEEARHDLTAAMRRRSAEMDQPYGRIVVRDQKWLWGSCSPRTGTVSLNARLVMAPPAVMDYIVVHELAHFRWRGHGVRFWERVARFCPAHQAHRRWLRENGPRLRFPA